MLYRKEIPCFIGYELIQIYQTIEKYSYLLRILFQFINRKVALKGRLYHIIHLAKQIDKEDRLVIKIFEPVYLLLVEVFHFMRSDDFIGIEIYNFEPIIEATLSCLVLFREHEPDKVLIAHLIFLAAFELARYLIKDSIDCFARERMSLIS